MILLILLGTIGATEIILVLVALAILFGGKKIPELMRGIGQGIREFKNASRMDQEKKADETKDDKK